MIWLQDGDALFLPLRRFITLKVWGDNRDIPGNTIAAVVIDGEIRAAVIFQNFDAHSGVMEITAASDDSRWMSRSVINDVFGYVFDQCECQAAVMRCDPEDERMSKIAQGLGFQRFDIPRLRGRHKAEAIYVLGDDEFRQGRFHKGKTYGQKRARTDAAA